MVFALDEDCDAEEDLTSRKRLSPSCDRLMFWPRKARAWPKRSVRLGWAR